MKQISTFVSLEQLVAEDMWDKSEVSQKNKHENTALNVRLLQPRSNLEQNELLLSWWNAELVNPISKCKYQTTKQHWYWDGGKSNLIIHFYILPQNEQKIKQKERHGPSQAITNDSPLRSLFSSNRESCLSSFSCPFSHPHLPASSSQLMNSFFQFRIKLVYYNLTILQQSLMVHETQASRWSHRL